MGLQFSRKKQSAFHWQAPITEHSQRFKTHKNHWSPSWLRKLQIQFTRKLWIPGLSFPLSNFHELEMLPLSCFPRISKKTNSFLFPEIFYGKQKIPFLSAPMYQGTQKSTSKTKLSLAIDSSLVGYAVPFSGIHILTSLHRNISTCTFNHYLYNSQCKHTDHATLTNCCICPNH